MADKRIDQLTYRNDVESTDKLHLNKSGQDYQTNLSDIIPVVITSTLQVEDTDVSLAARNDLSDGATVLTKGDTAVNDGYGGLYVVATGAVAGTRNITLANGNTAVYQFRSIIENVLNKTNLKSADLPINTIIKTRGLNSQNDGLNGNYIILSAGVYGGTPDEVVDFALDNGNVAKLLDLNVRTLRISNDVIWMTGTGSPEGVTSAAQGSIFSRTDGAIGTTVYIKEVGSGNTGWSAVGGTSIGVEEFTFDTIADMTAATVPVGGICKTNGYYTVGDGGGASYIVMTSGAYPYGTADETIDHTVNLVGGGTGVARQIVNNILTASKCGVQVGTNSTTQVQNMVDYGALSSGGTIVFNQGGDVILNQINIPEVPLIFEGNSRLYLADNANTPIINCPLSEYFVIKNLSIQGNKNNNGPISDVALIEVGGGNDFTIQNCLIDGSASIGVRFKDVSGAYVLDSRISGTENGSGIEICNATIECKITGNLITAIVGGSCITITSDDVADKATFVDISNNTLAGYNTSNYAIYIDNTLSTPSNCTFTDNFILAPNSTNDIHIDNTTPTSDGLVFHNNQVSESGVSKTHESINSASTINLKPTYTDWLILGSTAIDTITPMDSTQKVYNFEFDTTCNVNHNTGNILLKGGDTYLATAGDRLSLYWDGTNFREVARSGAYNTVYSASSKQFNPADAWNTASVQFQQVGGAAGINAYGSGIVLGRVGAGRPLGAIASKQTTADADQGGLAFFGHTSNVDNNTVEELGYWNHNRDFVTNGEVYALNTAGGSAYVRIDTGSNSDTGFWISENGVNRFRMENVASGDYFGLYNYGSGAFSITVDYNGLVSVENELKLGSYTKATAPDNSTAAKLHYSSDAIAGAPALGVSTGSDHLWLTDRAVRQTVINNPDFHILSPKVIDPVVENFINFSRASTAYYRDKNKVLSSKGDNLAMEAYDGWDINFESGGKQNLALHSNDFSNAVWTTSGLTSKTQDVYGPDSMNNSGWTFVEDSSASAHQVYQDITVANATEYTLSCWVKAGARTDLVLRFDGAAYSGGGSHVVRFNLSTLGTSIITGSPTNLRFEEYANGWYRVSATAITSAAGTGSFVIKMHNGSSESYTGDGTSDIQIFGAQVTDSPFEVPYMPTTTTAATYVSDTLDIPLQRNLPASGDDCTISVTIKPKIYWQQTSNTQTVYRAKYDNLDNSTITPSEFIYLRVGNDGVPAFRCGTVEVLGTTTIDAYNTYTIVGRVDNTTISIWVNGKKEGETTTAGVGSVSTTTSSEVYIGRTEIGANEFNGWIKDMQCWFQPLTDNEIRCISGA